MKMAMKILFISTAFHLAAAEQTNPIQKVIELISSLEAKLIKEGEAEEKAYKEFFEWCDDAAANKKFEIKTATAKKEKLEATITEAVSNAESAAASIEELSAQISTDQADLKAATEIRDKENKEFLANEAELSDAVDILGRAISVLERQGVNLIQAPVDMKNMNALLSTISTMIDAASFSGHDMQKLAALLQNKENDDDAELGAPAPDAYKSHSGGILDVLGDMKDKAEAQLSEARKAEMNSKHNFDMMKQSLVDAIAAAEHELEEAKAAKFEAEGTKATAEGDLAMTAKDLAEAEAAMATVGSDCMSSATDHEASVNGRKEELAALAKAKKIIQTSTAGAEKQTYSFFQISSLSGSQLKTSTDLRNFEVVNAVKRLAEQQHSAALAQLASRISAMLRYGATSGEDPFAKVKGLITEMIDRLMKEAAEEASFKAYCDEEMAKTKQKKEELQTDIKKLTAKIDQASAASAGLKADVQELQKELADLASSQAEMDKVRKDENAAFLAAQADLQQGLEGIQGALKVLREYYGSEEAALVQDGAKFDDFMQQPAKPAGHSKASGAGGSIIDFLEVIESDLAKNLAEIEAEEAAAATNYDKVTQENKVTTATKRQDVKYKTKEFTGLDKEIADLSSDRDSANTELDAVLEYDTKIKAQCIAKPETYEERKQRREAEIAGLKEALSILEGQAVFVQQGHRSSLRGISLH
jgi:hypothetical protein